MQKIIADCISKKELFDGIRYAEFLYKYKFEAKKYDSSFSIVTDDHDLELEWVVERSYGEFDIIGRKNSLKCRWSKVNIQSNQKIFGNILVKNGSSISRKYTFNAESSSIELNDAYCFISRDDQWGNSSSDCFITIEVYRRDDTVNSIFEDYSQFLENKEASDVMFVVEDEEFSAHKQIVSARSEVFAKMFETEMFERRTGHVEIIDIEPAIFRLLLEFIYTSKLESNKLDVLIKLIVAADKYSVKSLVSLCAYRLAKNLTDANVAEVLVTADMVKANFLRKDCIFYIMKNKGKVGATEGYKEMIISRPDLLSEIFLGTKRKYLSD